jgi:Glycosyltransferases, probably involved in cell wall biogenesis
MNTNSLPKITVAIVAYNAEKYIRKAITSVVNQDYPGDIEILVLYDEGSTDKTLQVINEIQKESLPSRRSLVVFQHGHTSLFRARMYSLKNFTGDYVHLFDYDNMMPSDRISKVVNHISKTGAGFLFSNARIIDSNDQDVGRFLVDVKDLNLLKLIRGNFVDVNTIVISRSCAEKLWERLNQLQHKYFDWVFEDWLLALLAFKHCNVHYMDDTYILYRIHTDNLTASSNLYTVLFNHERALKTLLAFYFLEYENLNSVERRQLQKAIIWHSNVLDKSLLWSTNSRYIKLFHYSNALLRKLITKIMS